MKLVIFDIDGTLCHSKYIDDKCYLNAFKKTLDIDIQNTDWNSYKHVTDYYITYDIIRKNLNIEPTTEIMNKVIDAYADELAFKVYQVENKYTAVKGAKEIVDHLQNNKDEFITGVASAGFEKTAKFKLGLMGLDFPDENIFCSGKYRTKHEMISAFIEQEKISGKTIDIVYYVGDREYDYSVSNDLNIGFIGVDYERNGKLNALGIDKVINDFDPIQKFLSLL